MLLLLFYGRFVFLVVSKVEIEVLIQNLRGIAYLPQLLGELDAGGISLEVIMRVE